MGNAGLHSPQLHRPCEQRRLRHEHHPLRDSFPGQAPGPTKVLLLTSTTCIVGLRHARLSQQGHVCGEPTVYKDGHLHYLR